MGADFPILPTQNINVKCQTSKGEKELSGTTFELSTEVIPSMIREIELAEKYVRIAIFQMHQEGIFKILSQKIKQGINVEILTLPYDSINDDVRAEVEQRFKHLEKEGAMLYFNKWNVGDPGRTTTAVRRWYSFHGKFIVTDRSAIALSANLIQSQELDAAILFRDDEEKIKEFNEKFEKLLNLFVKKSNTFDGSIHDDITKVVGTENHDIFKLPKNVDPIHENHWIRHYPIEICKPNTAIEEKLYITPFDCQGRNFIESLITEAEKFAYISTESFTDEDFSNFLVDTSVNKKIEIKILSGIKSMDFSDRIQDMFRDLLAQEIDIRTTEEDLHAKLLITDKSLTVSSVNLNRINLGWHKTKEYWRENTESLLVCKNLKIVELAKEKYLELFYKSQKVEEKLSEKLEDTVKRMFDKTFQLRVTPDARTLLAKFVLKKQIDVKKLVLKIGKITKKLMTHYKRTKVEKQDFISAMVLYNLSEGKQSYNQLKEKLDEVEEDVNTQAIINALMFAGVIEKEGDYYKINIEALEY